jgi:hypothetical protein
MAWITVIGLWTRDHEPQAAVRSASTFSWRVAGQAGHDRRLFASAVRSLGSAGRQFHRASVRSGICLDPGMAASHGHPGFRAAAFARPANWAACWHHSRESYANLKRLQAQITESEKLASIGQLVGGAAHELNNPIAAMLGYSDLLLTTPLNQEQQRPGGRKSGSMFAAPSRWWPVCSVSPNKGPAAMAPVDLNTVLRTAVKLAQPQGKLSKSKCKPNCNPTCHSSWETPTSCSRFACKSSTVRCMRRISALVEF